MQAWGTAWTGCAQCVSWTGCAQCVSSNGRVDLQRRPGRALCLSRLRGLWQACRRAVLASSLLEPGALRVTTTPVRQSAPTVVLERSSRAKTALTALRSGMGRLRRVCVRQCRSLFYVQES
eukprot:359572-Chlamydomonas_euryale.AAC.2